MVTLATIRQFIVKLPICCAKSGYTYIFQTESYIKIGRTENLLDRFKDIQSTCPTPLSIVAVSRGNCEYFLHYLCKTHRLRGEWFNSDCLAILTPLFSNGAKCMTCLTNEYPDFVCNSEANLMLENSKWHRRLGK